MNQRPKMLQLLGENTEETLEFIGTGEDFLNMTPTGNNSKNQEMGWHQIEKQWHPVSSFS